MIAALLDEWSEATGGVGDSPELRTALIEEEAEEVLLAIYERDLGHIAKELADLVYVIYGAARLWDIPLDACVEEVHRSNMTKVLGGIERRADGKILKGANFEEADIAAVLRRHDDKA
jgi:predicted HAD superfamily Cof-like phosphohydrolase